MKKEVDLSAIVNRLLDGLIFDGAHHKQYYLGEVAKLLGFNKQDLLELAARGNGCSSVEEYIEEYGEWEDGSPT